MESFCILNLPHSDSVLQMSHKIWPEEGNPFFRKTVGTYKLLLADLQLKITKTILASLDLDVQHFYVSDFQNYTSKLCIHHYSCAGNSTEEEVLCAHTDLEMFTVLYTGKEDGLQIRSKEGTWLNVKPLAHSFIIIIGDSLKAWSNGRLRSVEHRLVHNGWVDRISLPYFVDFQGDKEIWAPPKMVDNNYPRSYRPFVASQMKRDFYQSFDSKEDKPTFFNRYVGL